MTKLFWILLLFVTHAVAATPLPQIIHIEFDSQKIILLFDRKITKNDYNFFQLKDDDLKRDIYDFDAVLLPNSLTGQLKNRTQVKIAQNTPKRVRVVLSHPKILETKADIKDKRMTIFAVDNQSQIATLFEQSEKKRAAKKKPPNSKRSERVVVIDPGHGGQDCGAMGYVKVCEKVIVLKLAQELEKELKKRGYRVYMTRSSDIFIPLKNRTEIANAKNADIFISLHANAIQEEKRKSTLRGIETYFLSPARSERAKSVAALENKEDIEEMNHFSRDTVLGIISSQRLYASHRLATDIQFGVLSALKGRYQATDGGVREGPFWVLAGALMPSILLEMGYITHPIEGKLINQSAYQKLLALGIANGIDGYFMKNF